MSLQRNNGKHPATKTHLVDGGSGLVVVVAIVARPTLLSAPRGALSSNCALRVETKSLTPSAALRITHQARRGRGAIWLLICQLLS